MPKLSQRLIKEGMSNSIKDGAAVSVRDSIFDNFTIPFALAMGAGAELVGLVTAIPHLATGLFAPFIGKAIEWVGNRKRLCTDAWLIAHLLWIPIALIPIFFLNGAIWFFIFLLTLASLARNIGSTTWATWIADIVPEKTRGIFFGKRNMIASAAAFFAILGGGWLLGLAKGVFGFSILFSIAVSFGLLSNSYLRKMPDIRIKNSHRKFSFNLSEVFEIFKKSKDFRNFTLMMAFFNFAVYLAAPFFVVYMLREMEIGYGWFATIVAVEILVTIMAQPYWGKLADKYGDRPIMAICGTLAVLYPAFWFFISEPWHIILAVIVSGFGWAGFGLTKFNYMLDVTPQKHRPFYISNYKLLAGFGVVVGPIIGGFLAEALSNVTFLWLAGLQILFLLSFLMRGAAIGLFMPKIKETRIKRKYRVRRIFWKVVAIYPVREIVRDFEIVSHALHKAEHKMVRRKKIILNNFKLSI